MINYLCTSPKPKLQGTDALYNEIHHLSNKFNGVVNSIYPFSMHTSRYPIFLYGMHNLSNIRRLDRDSSVNHIFANGLYYLPFLYFLKKPIVYTVAAGLNAQTVFPSRSYLNKINTIIVSNERDYNILKGKGVNNVRLIRTGIDISNMKRYTTRRNGKLHLLLASSPWEKKQFISKGIILLLEALQRLEKVHITFLWRNNFPAYMQQLIQEYQVSHKTTFINEFIDINKCLRDIHGVILLVNDASLIKAYPHSLIESLVAGKPIILSKQIPLADFIKERQAGLVLNDFSVEALVRLIEKFRTGYSAYAENTQKIDPSIFSIDRVLLDYEQLYNELEKGD